MIKRILIGVIVFMGLTIGSLILYSYYNKDKIIKLFVTEANKSLNTPIDVGTIDFSLFSNFPHLSVSMSEVSIKESGRSQKIDLGKTEEIHFKFNLWDLIRGTYTIDEVTIVNGSFSLKAYKDGGINYKVVNFQPDSSGSRLSFNISSIRLRNVKVSYFRESELHYYEFKAEQLHAGWSTEGEIHKVNVKGSMALDSLRVNSLVFGERKFGIDGSFEINTKNNTYTIPSSYVEFMDADYSVEGTIGKDEYSFMINSEQADLSSLRGFLPEKDQKFISRYGSKGTIVFKALISKSASEAPGMEIDFSAINASIYHPEYDKSIDNLGLKGRYVLKDFTKPENATLSIQHFKGTLENKPISGNLEIRNFSSYPIKLNLQADVDLKDVLEFYPIPTLKDSEGSMKLDIDIQGRMKVSGKQEPMEASGQIDIKNVGFTWIKNPARFKDLSGNFIFNNEDIAISDFSGYWGESDFLINGFLNNVLQKMVEPETHINVEADLNSKYIDLDELLTIEQKDRKDTLFLFNIPAGLGLTFKCKVDRLNIGRFRSRNNYGNLEVNGRKAKLKNVSFNVAGGKVDLDAEINARHSDSIFVYSETAYDRIDIDSIFYIFKNFNQDFLEDRHLKGQVTANVRSSLDFDRYLNLNYNTMRTEASLSIRNGELNNFEPMQKLSRYLGGQNLDHLLFSDIENRIVIENKTIQLPEMEVRSNVTNISIRGTHTFDQRIDYYLKVPLNRNIKPDKDEAFGAIEDDGTSRAMLYLTIRGTTEDYKIAYDTRSVKKKIIEDIRKEGTELKEVFRNKGIKEEKTIELEEEYFDFEEDTVGTEKK